MTIAVWANPSTGHTRMADGNAVIGTVTSKADIVRYHPHLYNGLKRFLQDSALSEGMPRHRDRCFP
jgi:hypothetical protein